jgi:hypothetical protein
MSGVISLRVTCAALGIAVLLPHAGAAQDHAHEQPTWVRDVGVAGANVVVGGLTAAVTAAIRGHDVSEAFLKGAAGGGAVFVGKRVAVERFGGAGLLGREIASVGTSVVVNAGEGRGWFDEVWLPLGPAWMQVRPRARVRARVNLRDVGTLIWAATRSELHFDLGRSISNGATVFVARGHRILQESEPVNGFASGGVVVVGATNPELEVTQRHENVHVLQYDYLLQTVSRPLERWGRGWITDRDVPVDFDLLYFLAYPALLGDLREREAEVLEFR